MKKTRSFLSAVGVLLALAFTFSCSSDDDPDGAQGGVSSSSGGGNNQSSSSGNSNNGGGNGLCNGFVEGTERPHYGKSKAQFCDERDGKKYVYVNIGDQTWMAENLNYNDPGSKCYGEGGQVIVDWDEDDNPITEELSPTEAQDNRAKYGRLYNWETAKTVCPNGWHLPTVAEADILINYAGGKEIAGTKLKANSGWNEDGNSMDEYGFSALPGGYYNNSYSYFIDAGYAGGWWLAGEGGSGNEAYRVRMRSERDNVSPGDDYKSSLLSVRCLKN